jgi:hypothetical protein
MKLHKAILDIAASIVHLHSPVYGKAIFQLPVIPRIKASVHHMAELKLEDIHVTQEFPNVVPDDLAGMPPERAIEFKIKLQPGTAPIAKAPYNMSPVERHEKVWNERTTSTLLHRTISHTWEVWKHGIQIRIATVIGRSSRYLPCIIAEEVFEGTHGYCTTRCGTTRG